jgi:hypothetical protein
VCCRLWLDRPPDCGIDYKRTMSLCHTGGCCSMGYTTHHARTHLQQQKATQCMAICRSLQQNLVVLTAVWWCCMIYREQQPDWYPARKYCQQLTAAGSGAAEQHRHLWDVPKLGVRRCLMLAGSGLATCMWLWTGTWSGAWDLQALQQVHVALSKCRYGTCDCMHETAECSKDKQPPAT